MKRSAFYAGAVAILVLGTGAAWAQSPADSTYPSRPIRLIVPYNPAGAPDIAARIMAPRLSERLGQPVVVVNRPGGGGNIGTNDVAKSAPDGYTVGLSTNGPIAANVSLYSKFAYDPLKDLAPVTLVSVISVVIVVNPAVPVTSVRDLITLAKAKPGELSYGSSGIGTAAHLSGELFKLMTGVKLVHVPYSGDGAMIPDLLGGHIPIAFTNLPSVLPYIRSGQLKALAVTTEHRSTIAPEIPTLAETGVPGYAAAGWLGVIVAGGTSPQIIERLNTAIVDTLKMPDVHERLLSADIEPAPDTPEQFGAFIKSEIIKWAKVVRLTGVHVD